MIRPSGEGRNARKSVIFICALCVRFFLLLVSTSITTSASRAIADEFNVAQGLKAPHRVGRRYGFRVSAKGRTWMGHSVRTFLRNKWNCFYYTLLRKMSAVIRICGGFLCIHSKCRIDQNHGHIQFVQFSNLKTNIRTCERSLTSWLISLSIA